MNATELPEKVRAFVAINPARSIVSALEAVQNQLRSGIASSAVRWTKPEQIHLTLEFLGYVKRDLLDAFESVLGHVANESGSFQIRSEMIGCFPSSKRPRIIWAGLTGELDALQTLKKKLDVAFGALGFVPEKRVFHPHLTIGRVVDLKVADARRLVKEIFQFDAAQFGDWPVHEINLVQSILSPKGASYHVLKSFQLKKS